MIPLLLRGRSLVQYLPLFSCFNTTVLASWSLGITHYTAGSGRDKKNKCKFINNSCSINIFMIRYQELLPLIYGTPFLGEKGSACTMNHVTFDRGEMNERIIDWSYVANISLTIYTHVSERLLPENLQNFKIAGSSDQMRKACSFLYWH